MNLTLNEFMNKADEINELKVELVSEVGIYRWSTTGDNTELREYIYKQLKENLILNDCYLMKGTTTLWIKKEYIDAIIEIICNSETYDTIYDKLNKFDYITATKIWKDDIVIGMTIKINHKYREETRDSIIEQLESTPILTKKHYDHTIKIKNPTCDIKEECKHQCKTNYKKQKFDQIFNLN